MFFIDFKNGPESLFLVYLINSEQVHSPTIKFRGSYVPQYLSSEVLNLLITSCLPHSRLVCTKGSHSSSLNRAEVNHARGSYVYTRGILYGQISTFQDKTVNLSRCYVYVSTKPVQRLLNQELVEVYVTVFYQSRCSLKKVSLLVYLATAQSQLALPPWIECLSARISEPARVLRLGMWMLYHRIFDIFSSSEPATLQIGTTVSATVKLKIST